MRITARIVQEIRHTVRSYGKWMLDDKSEAIVRFSRCAEDVIWTDRRTIVHITCRACGLWFPVTRSDGE